MALSIAARTVPQIARQAVSVRHFSDAVPDFLYGIAPELTGKTQSDVPRIQMASARVLLKANLRYEQKIWPRLVHFVMIYPTPKLPLSNEIITSQALRIYAWVIHRIADKRFCSADQLNQHVLTLLRNPVGHFHDPESSEVKQHLEEHRKEMDCTLKEWLVRYKQGEMVGDNDFMSVHRHLYFRTAADFQWVKSIVIEAEPHEMEDLGKEVGQLLREKWARDLHQLIMPAILTCTHRADE